MDREMKKYTFVKRNHAVSEVIGALTLIAISVVIFSSIYVYVFPLPLPAPDSHVKLMGYVDDDGNAVIEHMGGEPLGTYKIEVKNVSGVLINSAVYQGESWGIGECIFPTIESPLIEEKDMVQIIIYSIDNEGEQQIFNGILKGKTSEATPAGNPMLISSLKTNTVEEDLICYNYTISQESALTYIYNWSVDGNSLTSLLMPFDTNSSDTVKDYSGQMPDGTVAGPTWNDTGVVGGAYSFDGINDYIKSSLPSVFNDISNNDFTISMWLKSGDVGEQWKRALEARKDDSNFVQFFQLNSEIHFGICENDLKSAVKTDIILNDTWYYISGTWDASEKSPVIYINGNISTEIGNRNYDVGSQESLHIGQRTDNNGNWLGMIDEFQLYDYILSSEQIYQDYLCSKDGFSDKRVIVSEETNICESWKCIVTSNDGNKDGEPIESNILNIVNYEGG